MGMLKTIDEIKEVEIEAGVVVNGVDNANLMSVDSTEAIKTAPEKEKTSEESIDAKEEKKKEEGEEKEEKEEKEEEKKEEEKEEENEADFTSENDSKPVKKRIGELTKKWRTAERERDFEREKIQELEVKLAELSAKVVDDSKPNKEDFDDEDEYIEALTDWKIESKLKALQKDSTGSNLKKREVDTEINAESEIYVGLGDAIENGNKKYKDFAKVALNKDLILSPEVAKIILDTDIPEDLMYFLGENPDESERISGLDQVRAAKEIGKLEIKLEKKKEEVVKPTIRKQSKAPEPIIPLRSEGVTEKDPNKMSPAEYKAWRSKK